MAKAMNEVEREAQREPIYWFAVLERARGAGDLEQAAEAVRRLRALGVQVKDRRKGVEHDLA